MPPMSGPDDIPEPQATAVTRRKESQLHYRFPERLFHPLDDLSELWRIGMSDLKQWLARGVMTSVVWLPVMSVVELKPESAGEAGALRHWEGYACVSEHQCGRVFRQGWIALREFATPDGGKRFRLPETSDDRIVAPGDLVILEAERKRMETKYPGLVDSYCLAAKARIAGNPLEGAIDPTYRVVRVDGREYRFGETQAKILRLLADAARDGEPWQSGKALLREAGSESYSLSNLFKRHPVWRELIASNQRGFYKLSEQFVEQLGEAPPRPAPGGLSSPDFS